VILSEVATWLERLARLLPELIGLWEAAKAPDPQAHLNASLALVRAMKDQQARETIVEVELDSV
jgi:hypothetical protein